MQTAACLHLESLPGKLTFLPYDFDDSGDDNNSGDFCEDVVILNMILKTPRTALAETKETAIHASETKAIHPT